MNYKKITPAILLVLLMSAALSGQIKVVNGVYHKLAPICNQKDYYAAKVSGSSDGKDYKLPEIIKSDFIVNSFEGDYGASQSYALIAADSSGNYAVVWLDERNGNREIYVQFYDSNDNPAGKNIKVMDEVNEWNIWPAIASNKKGDFIIVWAQDPGRILFQRFTNKGVKMGNNVQVNRNLYFSADNPTIAVAEDGRFLVTWYDADFTGRTGIYGRVFDAGGVPISAEQKILDDYSQSISSSGMYGSVAVDGNGGYVVVWSQRDKTNISRIFMQNIGQNGEKTGKNIMVSSQSDTLHHIFPSVASTADGKFMITWESWYTTTSTAGRFSARIYSAGSNFVTDQLTLDESSNGVNSAPPFSDTKNNFYALWTSLNGKFCQKILSDGKTEEKKTLQLNSDYPIYYIRNVSCAANDRFYGVGTFARRNDPEIYLQKFDKDMTPVNKVKKVNDDNGSSFQENPLVCFNEQGGYIILWEDGRNGLRELYGQVYDSRNNPVGNNIQINDKSEYFEILDKAVTALSDGKFAVAFTARASYPAGYISLQLIGSDGTKIGKNSAAENDYKYRKEQVLIKSDRDDNILAAWYDAYGNSHNAFFRQFNKSLQPVSPVKEITLNKDTAQVFFDQSRVTLSINKNLAVFAAWAPFDIKKNAYGRNIYGAVFDRNGIVISESLVLDTLSEGSPVYGLVNSLGENNKDYILIWLDESARHNIRKYYKNGFSDSLSLTETSGSAVWGAPQIAAFENRKIVFTEVVGSQVIGRFYNDNISDKKSFLIHEFDSYSASDFTHYYFNSVSLHDNSLLFAYESCRHGDTGFDIWAKVIQPDSIEFKPGVYIAQANEDLLFPNFPNPFNAATRIYYQLNIPKLVRISVYDAIGREVKILVDEFQAKGNHEIYFDAKGLPSGIYYCRLQTSKTTVNKMILIK